MPQSSALAVSNLVAVAAEYAQAARADNTIRAYASDWRQFDAWCRAHGMASLPAMPATVALYIAHLAQGGRKTATVRRSMVGIGEAHKAAGVPSPTEDEGVRTVFQGIRKTLGAAQNKKAPMLSANIAAGLHGASDRDRAILLLGFAGGFRRSELAGLLVEDCERIAAGYVVRLRRSKTNQAGEMERKFIAHGRGEMCPVRALELQIGSRTAGSLFGVCDKTIARILKSAAKRAGLDERKYSGHSLRRGLITEAHLAGVNDGDTMKHVGIKSREVFDGYVSDADLVARAVRVL